MKSYSWILPLTAFIQATNAWSPSDSYAPTEVSCERNGTLTRNATGISNDEQAWLEKRDAITENAMKTFLTRATANFSDTSFLDSLFENSSYVPRVGIAASGGGYRAMLSGAGMLAAFDNRTRGANENGLGGLLQATTYLSGLSGGNWLVGTLAWNNWTSIQDIIDGFDDSNTTSIWDISNSIISPGGENDTYTTERFALIKEQINTKYEAGYNISLVDVWGRALSYYFFPDLKNAGDALTWSSLRDFDVFQSASMPLPIVVADNKYPDDTQITLNTTVFEFNPFEMGSWDPSLHSFTDVKYLGTNVSNGIPTDEGKCVVGFDNTGFFLGASSDIFYGALLEGYSTYINVIEKEFLTANQSVNTEFAIFSPNPFKDTKYYDSSVTSSNSDSDSLLLVDGGSDGQDIPFIPLLQEERAVDAIFAFDNGDDTTENWPNGTALINTYQRQFMPQGKNMAFPYIPDATTFVEQGLNQKPTFFGCDSSNLTSLSYIPPLIVYIPNAEYSYASNTSTFTLSYSLQERLDMVQNGFEAATRKNLTEDSDFLSCVSCAVIRRKQEKLNITLPSECERCFQNYCYGYKSVNVSASSTNTSSPSTQGSKTNYTVSSAKADASSSAFNTVSTTTTASAKANAAISLSSNGILSYLSALLCIFGMF
ncbi:hypothetical protein KAFR_0C01630 [Kazachstania africana CBS 2517]|uniref:Lysophospholipase n=1 Tax=Kazachstania africana (strain ATCC 22294 / BCRC 22015 / CBS 2517 / CECT 1963 / NBRC 1671 / NRRL Y-8276) TaxID=1071382 RepID=H2AS06_KAZAF|nr:hypothetical protein KAFR_0C01630 [Kazachstania africana CBS 2517]CCF57156.1 hypothetical protein KAFR_0C01630 [Kazachstania africana CBS 2517]